jgi:DnaJ-class molecular chaperone
MGKSKNNDAPATRTCPTCGGDGRGVPVTREVAPGKYVEIGTKCPRCYGAGQVAR